ncbi:MAG: endonuclease, partial [Muribaculaceae bacterium]|nr:endonuclease [Muribaculaceae bacterium]
LMAQAPAGYYDSLEGKKGAELKKAVKQIGKKGFHAISYSSGTWDAFKTTDVRIVDGKECWWDMYSSNNVPVSSGHGGMNVEHSVANSWWGGTKNDAYKDIVHLNPSNADANSRKSNYPIGEINGNAKWDNGITFIGSPKSGQGGGCTSVYEPHDMYKGDFARVFMYMFTIYDDISWQNATNSGDGRGRMYTYTGGVAELQPWAYNLMLAWNVADPVSEKEINRNNGVQKEQGNRNPFIDLPDLGDYIWGSKKNEAYHVEGAHTPEPGPEDPVDPNPEDPKPEDPINPDLEGKYILVENQSDIVNGGEYLIVSPKTSLALSVTLGSNSTSITPTGSALISDKVIENAPEGAAHIKLESSGSAYRLHLYDLSGNDRGYLASAKAKDLHIVTTPDEAGTEATIKVNGGDATISFGTAGYLQYNSSAKMWRTYASGQEDPMLYKFIPKGFTSSIEEPVEIPFVVTVDGNCIVAPEGCFIFDLSGRRVTGENLQNGVYIIVSPEKSKTVKVMVRF